ncbi:MAG: PEP-CTERM sorting domain-containing protein [Fuerstiella sp.]
MFRITIVALSILVVTANDTPAGVLLNSSGQATKVTGISVGGTLYDATFEVGSYTDAFGTSTATPPTFLGSGSGSGSDADAITALDAIIAELNSASVTEVADLSGDAADSVVVPYELTFSPIIGTKLNARWTGPAAPAPPTTPWENLSIIGLDLAETSIGFPTISPTDRLLSFAKFTPSGSTGAVPEPSSLAVFGCGALGLVAAHRRRNRLIVT